MTACRSGPPACSTDYPAASLMPSAGQPGTQLVRSWHGRTISVLVTDDGFLFEEQTYGSLTAIAREVTGAGWSGSRFFGFSEAKS